MKKKKLAALGLLVIIGAVAAGFFWFEVVRENLATPGAPAWGVTFSKKQALFLGLDWKQTYTAILDDLGVRHFRIAVHWDDVEPRQGRFDFRDLDWMLTEAASRNAKVTLAIGRRTPRWPECHDPLWASKLSEEQVRLRVLGLLRATVEHTKKSGAVIRWQVENEPLLDAFGECPPGDPGFLLQEIALVRSLDPTRPVMTTESGELSTWTRAAGLVDTLGISLYRVTWSKFWGNFYYPLTPGYYRAKAGAVGLLGPNVIITELQAEPWGERPITEMSVDEQFISMPPERIRSNIEFARRTGFREIYLWGAEWWYWLKTTKDRPEIWDGLKGTF